VVQNAAGTSADLFLSLGYNPAGQIASRSLNNENYAWIGHYGVTRAYTTNGLNQYTAAGGPAISYDPNGNLISDGSNTYKLPHREPARHGGRGRTGVRSSITIRPAGWRTRVGPSRASAGLRPEMPQPMRTAAGDRNS
jgi:hypothetical protein